MIYEEIDLGLDIIKLREYVEKNVFSLPITMQSRHFGGWSITSSNGEYTDGWEITGHFKNVDGKIEYNKDKMEAKGVAEKKIYDKPTVLYDGPLKEMMERVASLGLNPRRARISMLEAHGSIAMHRDSLPQFQMVRLHIPIITNEGCFFVTENERQHIQANGNGFLVKVNQMHQIINEGSENWYLIIINVWDTKKISKFHQIPVS